MDTRLDPYTLRQIARQADKAEMVCRDRLVCCEEHRLMWRHEAEVYQTIAASLRTLAIQVEAERESDLSPALRALGATVRSIGAAVAKALKEVRGG